ncbi:MAG: hypothetical protein WCP28_05020 [Actinomycetes bacterium]
MDLEDFWEGALPEHDFAAPRLAATGANTSEEGDATPLLSDTGTQLSTAETVTASPRRRRARSRSSVRLTGADHNVLLWLARFRLASIDQLALRLGKNESALRSCLPRLRREGLCDYQFAAESGRGKLWFIRQGGLDVIGSSLPASGPCSLHTIAHTILLGDLAVAFELGDETVLSEREIRSLSGHPGSAQTTSRGHRQTRPGPTTGAILGHPNYYVRLVSPKSGTRIPDKVIVRQTFPSGASGSLAVELELSLKNRPLYRNIIAAYERSSVYSHCYFFIGVAKNWRTRVLA